MVQANCASKPGDAHRRRHKHASGSCGGCAVRAGCDSCSHPPFHPLSYALCFNLYRVDDTSSTTHSSASRTPGWLGPGTRLDATTPTVTAAKPDRRHPEARKRAPGADLDRLSNCQKTTSPQEFICPGRSTVASCASASSYSSYQWPPRREQRVGHVPPCRRQWWGRNAVNRCAVESRKKGRLAKSIVFKVSPSMK